MTLARPQLSRSRSHVAAHKSVFDDVLGDGSIAGLTLADQPIRAQQFDELVPLALAT
jgi:hypothetical protein